MMKNKKSTRRRERRSHPRYSALLKAHCFHVLSDGTAERTAVKVTGLWGGKGAKPQSRGVVRDISFGGLYLESVRQFREGTILVIELQVPGKAAKVVVIGLVRWVKAVKGDPPFGYGLGIQFIYMQKVDWEMLQKLFRKVKTSTLKPVAAKRLGKK